jgi:DNA topoisomerase-3
MSKLLGEGRTELLTGFKSMRTGRNFKAYLVKQPDGKIGFEFEKKEAASKSAAAKNIAAKKAAKKTASKTAVKKTPARKKAVSKT